MSPYFLSAFVVVSSIVVYQVCMKLIPEGINPISALLTFYISALVFTLLAASMFKLSDNLLSVNQFTLPAVLVGLAIVGIELGYLYMYRSGWALSAAPLFGMGGAAIVLCVIGYFAFQQPMTLKQLCGMGMCLAGLYLISPQTS